MDEDRKAELLKKYPTLKSAQVAFKDELIDEAEHLELMDLIEDKIKADNLAAVEAKFADDARKQEHTRKVADTTATFIARMKEIKVLPEDYGSDGAVSIEDLDGSVLGYMLHHKVIKNLSTDIHADKDRFMKEINKAIPKLQKELKEQVASTMEAETLAKPTEQVKKKEAVVEQSANKELLESADTNPTGVRFSDGQAPKSVVAAQKIEAGWAEAGDLTPEDYRAFFTDAVGVDESGFDEHIQPRRKGTDGIDLTGDSLDPT